MHIRPAAHALLLCVILCPDRGVAVDRPNILVIFADDLGWSDLGCQGSERFHTPHLDRLAQQGMRFTQAYAAAPICSASRAALLTGNSTARNGFEFVVKKEACHQDVPTPLLAPPFTIDLNLDHTTIAEALGGRVPDRFLWQVAPERASQTLSRLESDAWTACPRICRGN